MPEPRVAIVVPWRPGSPDRERAWEWAERWWKQFDWPIHIVEHEGKAPFSRSWCINEGARRAWPWDILIAIDADVFTEDPQQVRDGVRVAWETGRLTIPLTVGADLNDRGTRLLVAGQPGWEKQLHKRREVCTSRVWIMRRDLFEVVGGFDERFRGWGHEDVAAFHSMRTLRGCEQLPGTCYHLWHTPSFPKARRTREWSDGNTLVQRYLEADRQGWPALAPILAERTAYQRWAVPEGEVIPATGPQQDTIDAASVDVMVLTAGRKSYLEQTLASFAEKVHGDIGHRTILDDSGDARFGKWLGRSYPEYQIVTTRGKVGFTQAIRTAWRHELQVGGSPYIFHLEEDFTFDRDIELSNLIRILEMEPKVAQAALLRGPFFPPEIEAGGIVEEDPDAYDHREAEGLKYLVHGKFFTTNPCLYRRSLLRVGWPSTPHSETRFTRVMARKGYQFAFLGDGEPMVTHIGVERTNNGY